MTLVDECTVIINSVTLKSPRDDVGVQGIRSEVARWRRAAQRKWSSVALYGWAVGSSL